MSKFEKHQKRFIKKALAGGLAASAMFGLSGCGEQTVTEANQPIDETSSSSTFSEADKAKYASKVESPPLSPDLQELAEKLKPDNLVETSSNPEELAELYTTRGSDLGSPDNAKQYATNWANRTVEYIESVANLGYSKKLFTNDFSMEYKQEIADKYAPFMSARVLGFENIDTTYYVGSIGDSLSFALGYENGDYPVLNIERHWVDPDSIKVESVNNEEITFKYTMRKVSEYDFRKYEEDVYGNNTGTYNDYSQENRVVLPKVYGNNPVIPTSVEDLNCINNVTGKVCGAA